MNIMRALAMLSLALLPLHAAATAQEPDIIMIDGQREELNTNPLVRYLVEHPNALPKSDVVSSSNWRGYVATWEDSDGELVLKRVDVTFSDPDSTPDSWKTFKRDVTPELFPGAQRIVATWYSGALVIPRGELVDYVHMGYGSTYERYLILKVKAGRILARQELNARAFEVYRLERFEAFKRAPGYAAKLKEIKRDEGATFDEEFAERFLFDYESETYLSADDGPQ